MRGWRHRAERQAELIGDAAAAAGHRRARRSSRQPRACTSAARSRPSWQDRIAVGDLGYRSKAVLTRYPEGIMLQRSGGQPDLDPRRVDHRDPHRTGHRRQGADARRASWRSGGGCRRAPRSTPGSAATTATDYARVAGGGGGDERQSSAGARGRPRSSPAPRSAPSARRSARRCSPPACPATRRR